MESVLCMTEEEAKRERCKDILSYCSMITTSDGIKAYVAKRDFLSITSKQIIREAMLSYSDDRKGSMYADVTQLCGETIFGSRFVQQENFEYVEKKIEYKIPCVQNGGRLFYVAS